MRGLAGIIIAMLALIGISTSPARALEATPSPTEYFSDIFITAYTLDPDSAQLSVIELYNDSAIPKSVDGWSVRGMIGEETVCAVELLTPDMFIPPGRYVAFADPNILTHESTVKYTSPICKFDEAIIDRIELVSPLRTEEAINNTQVSTWVRKGITKTYRDTGDAFKDNFADISSRIQPVIYADNWYIPLDSTQLQIAEIVPRALDCAPNSERLDCSDYVKVYNPTTGPIDLSQLRLRIGDRDQAVTAGNAIITGGLLPPGAYGLINKEADGSSISITDGGGWVWFEDVYGLNRLDETIVQYESASSASKIGWAWAYDVEDESWRWTSTTTPYNQPSRFTLPVVEEEPPEELPDSDLKPCASDQFRNPETNRCKKLESSDDPLTPCGTAQERNPETNRCRSVLSASSTLTTCGLGQERNPETNRCRSLLAVASSLKPCDIGEERNPDTNRCRQIASSTESLKPCDPGQERNPETNRCRKLASTEVLAATNFPVEPIVDTGQAFAAWWALGGVVILGAGYGAWEWRHEIGRVIQNIMTRSRNI